MEWEETSVNHLIPPPCEQGQLKQCAQDCVKWASEHLWGWRLHNLPGKCDPAFNHPYGKIDLTFKPNLFQSMPLVSSLSTGRCCEDPDSPSFLLPMPSGICSQLWGLPEPFLLKTGKSQISQPLLLQQMFQTLHHLSSLFLGSLLHTHLSCTSTSVPTSGHITRMRPHHCWAEGEHTSLSPFVK